MAHAGAYLIGIYRLGNIVIASNGKAKANIVGASGNKNNGNICGGGVSFEQMLLKNSTILSSQLSLFFF
ncbi:MAG TPA: hypothetical protein PK002_06555, partial [Cellvibrio sp.]|nr:hypothetical protein [Cellvibrio sp.]